MTIARELANLLNSNGKVEGTKIADDAVDSAHYAPTSVDGEHIANDTITATQIAGDTITSTELANNAVITAKLNTTGTMPAWDGSALTDLPYDIAFTAGFDKDMIKENVAVGTYGELVMARAGTFVGEAGYADTAPTGSLVAIQVLKNGSTIYTTTNPHTPSFAAGSTSLTTGTLSTTTFVSGDRITFKITAIGSTVAGQGVRFTLKCKV